MMTEQATAGSTEEGYGGLPSAFPYAFRRSTSAVLRLYVVVSAILGLLVAVLIALGLVVWLGNPTGVFGERALLGVVAIFLLAPLFAPVLLVARRHRRGRGAVAYDRALGLAGFAFVCSLWIGLVVSVPEAQQEAPTGPLAPVAAVLYGLPQSAAFLPPLVGAVLLVVAHRLRR